MPSKSYSLKRKAWEELNRIIVATVPYDNSMVDPDFNLNEHDRLLQAAMYLIDNEDDFEDYQLQVAEDVLEKTCYGHRVDQSAGDLVLAYYEEAQENPPDRMEYSLTKSEGSSGRHYFFRILTGERVVFGGTALTTSETQKLARTAVQVLKENGDLPEGFLEDLEGEE